MSSLQVPGRCSTQMVHPGARLFFERWASRLESAVERLALTIHSGTRCSHLPRLPFTSLFSRRRGVRLGRVRQRPPRSAVCDRHLCLDTHRDVGRTPPLCPWQRTLAGSSASPLAPHVSAGKDARLGLRPSVFFAGSQCSMCTGWPHERRLRSAGG